jgi:hypothetical protein
MNMIQKTAEVRRAVAMVTVAVALSGCGSLLPDAKQQTQTPWHSYADAQAMFDKILPGKTRLVELKALGVDPDKTPNIKYLGHADLLRRLVPASSFDLSLLDPGLQECLSSQQICFGYEVEQVTIDRKRFGNFWLDFLNFKRQISVSGWQFDAVVVIKNDTVVYKLWSGAPNLQRMEVERSPLGPLQGFGSSMIRR